MFVYSFCVAVVFKFFAIAFRTIIEFNLLPDMPHVLGKYCTAYVSSQSPMLNYNTVPI